MASLNPSDEELAAQASERAAVGRRIVESDAHLRVVVAGPGTGKTFCFRGALERAGGGLALTFINNLADMMRADLADVADVYTCHGYAKRLLYEMGAPGFPDAPDYYPPLFELLAADINLSHSSRMSSRDLGLHFARVERGDPVIRDALALGAHYRAVTHDDCVLRVTEYLLSHPEATPTVPLLVVDEFQDFNRSEARFLWLLGMANKVLLAGDDDQALYTFKGASSRFLRLIHARNDSECHSLPYCSRSPRAVTDAVDLVVQMAHAEGKLDGRLPKRFECYLPDKLADSRDYPRLRHVTCTVENNRSPYIGLAVDALIDRIPRADWVDARNGGYPCVLVVGPVEFVKRTHSTLVERGRVAGLKRSTPPEVLLYHGYSRLAFDSVSRLGWRIVVHCRPPEEWATAVATALDDDCCLADVLPMEYVSRHLEVADALASAVMGQPVADTLVARVPEIAGLPLADLLAQADDAPDCAGDSSDALCAGGILCTSLAGCKGLSASHVFLVGMNDGHFPHRRASITDDEICQLIVALSRTRKSCTLLSTGRFGRQTPATSVFVDWLSPLFEGYKYSRNGLEALPLSTGVGP
jgi:AAA domain